MNRLLIFIVGSWLICNMSFAQTPTYHSDPHWHLKWEDNFDDSFDSFIWLKAYNGDHGSNCLYQKENVWVEGGNLVIEANSDRGYCPPKPHEVPTWACGDCTEGWHPYTSGWVETRSAYFPHYGYIEARVKLPFIPNFFHHAFWTWKGYFEQARNQAEIDIFEMASHFYPSDNIFTTSVHECYKSTTTPDCDERKYTQIHTIPNFTYTDWHTYAIEWDVNRIVWYLDSIILRTLPNHDIIDPVRIILGIGVANPIDAFREQMYVDYVKVYQLHCDLKPVTEILNYDNPQLPNYYNYAVKKSISLNGISSLKQGQKVSLRATDYIELTSGFEVPLNAELYLDVTPCVARVKKEQDR